LFVVSWWSWERKPGCNLKTLGKKPVKKSIKFLFRVKNGEENGLGTWKIDSVWELKENRW